jgi:hypothetical protein
MKQESNAEIIGRRWFDEVWNLEGMLSQLRAPVEKAR